MFDERVLIFVSGANPNVTTSKGNSSLHAAVDNNNELLTKLLLDAGANVSRRNMRGLSPLDVAAHHGNVNLVWSND